jgi:hypothetical protein
MLPLITATDGTVGAAYADGVTNAAGYSRMLLVLI